MVDEQIRIRKTTQRDKRLEKIKQHLNRIWGNGTTTNAVDFALKFTSEWIEPPVFQATLVDGVWDCRILTPYGWLPISKERMDTLSELYSDERQQAQKGGEG